MTLTTEQILAMCKQKPYTTREICNIEWKDYDGCLADQSRLKKTLARLDRLANMGKLHKEKSGNGRFSECVWSVKE